MYIVVEGLDGSYKSTVCRKLLMALEKQGKEAVLVRQPGGTPISEQLRELVKASNQEEEMLPFSESMLFLAARNQLFSHVIEPALKEGKTVVSDRCNLSTIAYQSYKGVDEEYLYELIKHSPWYRQADILILIDIPTELAEERIHARSEPSDHLEKRLSHCLNVYQNFDANKVAKNIIRINGMLSGNRELSSDEITKIAVKKILALSIL